MLEYTFDTIAKYFPDYDESPFVQEKFLEDWSPDRTHMWQQNRGVVGHNLKIAWNLMRMYSLKPKPEYEALARKIAEVMPAIGGDQQRGGWYDVMERERVAGETDYRFAFHDRKAWWQQEQGILAYLILDGVLGGDDYLRIARESSAFYNAFFLDHDDGAVYFNVLANGIAYLMGTERFKGSHSMSMYHSGELAYLAAGLHQPADHQAAAGPVLQAAAGRVQAQHPARVAGHPAAGQHPHRRGGDRRQALHRLRRRRA